MKTLFIPAISLLNRLGYTKKFAIMGILALVAISMLAMNQGRSMKNRSRSWSYDKGL